MNRIRELRKQMDMTQKELAKHLQIADSTLSYWEMGKYEPDTEALMNLSKFFQVPVDYVIGCDFTKWDITGNRVLYPDTESLHLTDSVISVSESETVYSVINKNENLIEPEIDGKQLYESAKSSISDTTKRNMSFNRTEFEGLTQEEIDLLAEYAMFIKFRRK